VPIYVGFDSSTQSLSAVCLRVERGEREVILERSIAFDEALPQYGTRRGVITGTDGRVVTSPPAMWAEALDLMWAEIGRGLGADRKAIAAVSGAAQQHGSVYMAAGAGAALAALRVDEPLGPQVRAMLSRPDSPVWLDASTSDACREITAAVGGDRAMAAITGSRAFERFTGPQIRAWWARAPEAYAATERVHLVSSFLASLLVGRHAPVEPGDASGMNLLDLASGRWAEAVVAATAPDLSAKLPPVVPAESFVGGLSSYWQRRHGLPASRVVVWTGDNPSSLVGTGVTSADRLAVSLGTSDTVFGAMDAPRPSADGTGHVFGAPTGRFMGLTCFANGSLARERVRDECGVDWSGFSAALAATPAGNGGAMMLPLFVPEITPFVPVPGVRAVGLSGAPPAVVIRACVEGQMLSMARHAAWMWKGCRAPRSIVATGGAASNRAILQVMADVFDAEVRVLATGNSSALGAALRAVHAEAAARGAPMSWDDVTDGVVRHAPGVIRPVPEHVRRYEGDVPLFHRNG
jgi:xylulokinase